MASCRCTEINNLSNDIEVLSDMLIKICRFPTKATSIMGKCASLSNIELELYEADYRVDVSERINKLGDNLELLIQDAKSEFNTRIIDMNNQKTTLEAEDQQYHDEQKKLEEEQKQKELDNQEES